MTIDEKHFRHILNELIQDNPLACRGVLGICEIEFTSRIATLAVTLGARSRLLVNLGFLREHCTAENDVKAILLHEFLHVLLRHTERIQRMTPVMNVALDAIINAIIHRKVGCAYSDFFDRFYREAKDMIRLLRPPKRDDWPGSGEKSVNLTVFNAWQAIYDGKLVAEDVLDLCRRLAGEQVCDQLEAGWVFIGNHGHGAHGLDLDDLDGPIAERIRATLRELDGRGIWRNLKGHTGASSLKRKADRKAAQQWRRTAWEALCEAIVPDRRARLREAAPFEYSLPVLNERDRRAFLRTTWNPLIGPVIWEGRHRKPGGAVQIYFDVSGSMAEEMNRLIALLIHFQGWLKQPFWAFSTLVVPARIVRGQIETTTTGGTSINAVLRHAAETRPRKALIITDGIVEQPNPELLRALGRDCVRAIITSEGKIATLAQSGIPCRQLPAIADAAANTFSMWQALGSDGIGR